MDRELDYEVELEALAELSWSLLARLVRLTKKKPVLENNEEVEALKEEIIYFNKEVKARKTPDQKITEEYNERYMHLSERVEKYEKHELP